MSITESHSLELVSGIDIAASWGLGDKNIILDVIKRAKQDSHQAIDFYKSLIAAVPLGNTRPLHIGITTNKVTDNGMQRHAELICMKTSRLFTHYAIGTGSSATTSQTNALDAELARAYMDSDDGFRVSAGTCIIECGYFDETYPTYTASEAGCFDGDGVTDPDNEIMEWRAVYPPSQQVTHTVNVNFMTYIHTIFLRAL